MRHVVLTCKNHPDLRWATKEIAVSDGKYNGMRSLFYLGVPTGRGMHADGSGLSCSPVVEANGDVKIVNECDCSVNDLVIAPEDALVRRS